MRKREQVETDGKRVDLLTLEVLLDIRDLLLKQDKKPVGRPRKKRRSNATTTDA